MLSLEFGLQTAGGSRSARKLKLVFDDLDVGWEDISWTSCLRSLPVRLHSALK
jgi:hypothetical protein